MADTNPLFDQINNLWTKESKVTTETKAESIYMINRFLSLSPDGFLAALDLNQVAKAPEWSKLPFLFNSIQRRNPPRSTYPKVQKEKRTPIRQRALDRICRKFCLNEFHGLQVLALLEMQGLKIEAD